MPSYRSESETEIRTAVVSRLRSLRPDVRIIHEIQIDEGKRRADILAVCRNEIYAVEIKSEKDTLTRLADQQKSMRNVAHSVIVAMHEKHLYDEFSLGNDVLWVYPVQDRVDCGDRWIAGFNGMWTAPGMRLNTSLPHNSITVLWRDELAWMCSKFRVSHSDRSTKAQMINSLRWHITGQEMTMGICDALRTRVCCEADPPVSSPKPEEQK